ncbi:MAG: hypothetical protein BHW07_01630 [Clostridium sp. CAG_433_25_7]|nr:MAG: hypothetical protein BHW07_01630 [Clostridium sp. CAG_433_25_7]
MTFLDMWGLALTLIVFFISIKISKYLKKIPPILITGVFIIFFLKYYNIPFESYNKSASILTMLLGPATIALGYPLYKNLHLLKRNKRAIYSGFTVAILSALISTYFLGNLMHLNKELIMSILPKSITTPLAVEISNQIHGLPQITACIVFLTGLFGALFSHDILKRLKIKSDIAKGIAIGASSHVMGTSSCVEKKREIQITFSTVALIIVGLLTSFCCILIFN